MFQCKILEEEGSTKSWTPPKRKISFEEKLVEEAPTDAQIDEFILAQQMKRKKRRQSASAHVECFVSLFNFRIIFYFINNKLRFIVLFLI